MRIVYTAGTFDLFHIGHVRMIRAARGFGDKVIVAVSTDELVEQYKGKRPSSLSTSGWKWCARCAGSTR